MQYLTTVTKIIEKNENHKIKYYLIKAIQNQWNRNQPDIK